METNNLTSDPTFRRLLTKAEQMCVSKERCLKDIETKLKRWNTPAHWIDKIGESLINANFIDEERYCRAFVKDKFRFNKWGKTKIKVALKQKGISEKDIEKGLQEIDNETYSDLINTLLKTKWKTLKGSGYEKKAKAMRFLQSRGFENEYILQAINYLNSDENN